MEYVKKFGNFLKKGDVDSLVKQNWLLFLIFGVLYLFSYAFLHDDKSLTMGSMYLSTFVLFSFYFRWIKTNGGKTNFYIANVIATLVILLGAGSMIFLLKEYVDFDLDVLASLGAVLLMISTVATAIYFGLVFLLRRKTNAKIFKGNINTYVFYSLLGLDVLQLLINTFARLSDVMDAGEAILYICNFIIMLYVEYVLTKYVYFYQEHKTGKGSKTCTSCGFAVSNKVSTCPECGGVEFTGQKTGKNIFTEIEEFHEKKKKPKLATAFQVDNLPNGSVGTKIKTYARIGMKIVAVVVFFALVGSFVFAGATADTTVVSSGSAIWSALWVYLVALVMYYIGVVIFYVIMYFNFLLLTGFGAIIEDVNEIKNKK